MAERPFIATDDEIRAALEDGTVTVWRDVEPQPKWQEDPTFITGPPDSWAGRYQSAPYGDPEVDEHYCPLGAPGDVLWWQEEWGTGCRITTTNTSVGCELRDGRWQWRVEVERKEPTT